MATDYNVKKLGQFVAGEDLTDWQFKVVQLSSLSPDGSIIWQKPSALTASVPLGVLRNQPLVGNECIVDYEGITKVYLGGSQDIQASRPVKILQDGTVIEGGNFGITVSKGSPGDIIEVLLGRAQPDTDNFSYELIQPGQVVVIQQGQAMNVHGCLFCNDGVLHNEGTLYIEE